MAKSWDLQDLIDGYDTRIEQLKAEEAQGKAQFTDCFTRIADILLKEAPIYNSKIQDILECRNQALTQLLQQRDEQDLKRVLLADRLCAEKASEAELVLIFEQTAAEDAMLAELKTQQQTALQQLEEQTAIWSELDQEVSEKLKVYQKHRYYQYLKKRFFGQEQYRGLFFIVSLDRWLADRVNFTQNAANENILLQIREQNDFRLNAKKSAYDNAGKAAEDRLEQIRDKLGLTEVSEQVRLSEDLLDKICAFISGLEQEISQYANYEDKHWLDAKKRLSEHLQTLDSAGQRRAVHASETTEDDRLLQKVRELEVQLQRIWDEIYRLQLVRQKAYLQYLAAKKAEERQRRRDYDSWGGGGSSGGSWGSGGSSGNWGGSSGGSSFGGGSSSSSSSFGGGGHSTTDSF